MTRTIAQLFDLSGRTALVTGGSRGLGLQMAHALGGRAGDAFYRNRWRTTRWSAPRTG